MSKNHKNTLDGVYQKRKMMLNETFSVIFKQRAFVLLIFSTHFLRLGMRIYNFIKVPLLHFSFKKKRAFKVKRHENQIRSGIISLTLLVSHWFFVLFTHQKQA